MEGLGLCVAYFTKASMVFGSPLCPPPFHEAQPSPSGLGKRQETLAAASTLPDLRSHSLMQKTSRPGEADDVFLQLDNPHSRYQAVLLFSWKLPHKPISHSIIATAETCAIDLPGDPIYPKIWHSHLHQSNHTTP